MVLIIKYSYVVTIEMAGHKANHLNCILGVVLAFFFSPPTQTSIFCLF